MRRIISLSFLVLAFAIPAGLKADESPSYHGPLSASERAFVSAIQSDFDKRFPRAAVAENAGYVRYTNADNTGAISYANMHWTSNDIAHPSQLWYDKTG